jgi:hypothetical protein
MVLKLMKAASMVQAFNLNNIVDSPPFLYYLLFELEE